MVSGHFEIVQDAVAWPLVWLAFSVLYMVLQLVSVSTCYESYLHSKERDTYGRGWYSLSLALGFSGLVCFSGGYLWLAYSVITLYQ